MLVFSNGICVFLSLILRKNNIDFNTEIQNDTYYIQSFDPTSAIAEYVHKICANGNYKFKFVDAFKRKIYQSAL